MKGSTATMGFLAALSAGSSARADIVLSEMIMKLSQKAAHLAAEAYQPEPACDWCTSLVNYIEEPDQALVAEDDAGYCFGVFRGTTPTAVDWGQNIDPRNEPVCTTKDRSACCTTRQGFYDAYITSYHQKMENEVRKCASKCDRPNECVVLTGHSQGGAVASIAAVRMAAVPVADPNLRRKERKLMVDEIPSPVKPLGYTPELVTYDEVSPGHLVART